MRLSLVHLERREDPTNRELQGFLHYLARVKAQVWLFDSCDAFP